MEFLKDNGFTEEEIKAIVDKYDDSDIDLFLFNKDNVLEVITYLKEYGIKDIPRLLLERMDIFFLPAKRVAELFSKYEKESVIASLAYDATMFDEMI